MEDGKAGALDGDLSRTERLLVPPPRTATRQQRCSSAAQPRQSSASRRRHAQRETAAESHHGRGIHSLGTARATTTPSVGVDFRIRRAADWPRTRAEARQGPPHLTRAPPGTGRTFSHRRRHRTTARSICNAEPATSSAACPHPAHAQLRSRTPRAAEIGSIPETHHHHAQIVTTPPLVDAASGEAVPLHPHRNSLARRRLEAASRSPSSWRRGDLPHRRARRVERSATAIRRGSRVKRRGATLL